MGESRRRRSERPGGVAPHVHVATVEAGEADFSLGEILRRGAALVGAEFANCYVLTNYAETSIDPQTGAKIFPRRFVVGRFLGRGDAHKPAPDRRQEILGDGASWAEAFARAAIHLRGGAA